MRLDSRVAVVTGGNSGIGAAVTQELSRLGAQVVIFGRHQETLEATLATLGDDAHAVQGDAKWRALSSLRAAGWAICRRGGARRRP